MTIRSSTRVVLALVMCVAVLGACSSADDSSSARSTTTGATTNADVSTPAEPAGDVADCPEEYRSADLGAGTHDGFTSAEQERTFHLLLPESEGPDAHPLFVALTGTVQEEQAFLAQSQLDQLADDGWIVVAPVRNDNGIIWKPWDAMRTGAQTQPNPDETFVMDLVACLSARLPVDPARIFVGGISIGGTFTNYLLRRHSDVLAGGIVGSGNWILTDPPKDEPLDAMTVIVAWGGDTDQWTGCPDGRMGAEYAGQPGCVSADFVGDSAKASQYYASQDAVRHIACTKDVGHIWIEDATAYWGQLLADSPKGTTEPVDLGSPPPGVRCTVDPFVRDES